MKFTLRILGPAVHDANETALYIVRDSVEAAMRIYKPAEQTYQAIRESPERWPRYEMPERELAGLRKRAVVGFRNFLVFYRIVGNRVEIVRVLHGARDIPSALADDSKAD